MCEKMQKLIDEKCAETRNNTIREIAINFYKAGTSIENIIAGLGVSQEQVLAWIEKDQQEKN